ncbi:SDR family oxidoreductase [soil metagenome]
MNISIMGCGWLGFPLAQQLIQEDYRVKGSTTSDEKLQLLKENGIEPYRISIPDDLPDCSKSPFWKSNILFLNIPPQRRKNGVAETYPEKIKSITDILESPKSTIEKVVFASTTSVYPKASGYFTEDNSEPGNTSRPSGEAVLAAESILQDLANIKTIILRFGGLYGYERHPVKYLAGRSDISSPLEPVNLIHQDDCIRIIKHVLKSDMENGIYNAVSDGHPPRKMLYESAANHFGLPAPKFDDKSESVDRVISNEKLKKDLNFTFTYPNPLDHSA